MELKFYGNVKFEGKEYLLLEEAYIGNETTKYITVMQATALDKNYDKVLVKWKHVEFFYKENLELDDYDYSKPTNVTYL